MRIGFAIAIALIVAAPGPAQQVPDAAQVIAAAKQATGGAEWDKIDGSYEVGLHGDERYTTWLDYRHYGMLVMTPKGSRGFNGTTTWKSDAGGAVTRDDSPEALREAIVTAYVSNNGYFFPDRFPARLTWLRSVSEGGATYDVVEALPQGGRAIELWFDRATHLLVRVVDTSGNGVTVEGSDFRRVGALLIPFAFVVKAPDGTVVDRAAVATVVLGPARRSRFDPPATP